MRVFALTISSLALLAAHVGCGGKTVLLTSNADASVSTRDASVTMPGCPDQTITGGACSTPGQQCSQAVCGVILPCVCTDGAWECEGTSCGEPEPDATVFLDATVACPEPTEITEGSSCPQLGLNCDESVCDGEATTSCLCSEGGWKCGGVSCGELEPDSGIISPPPSSCAIGASCEAGPSSCMLEQQGPCGSDILLGCEGTNNPTYQVVKYPCTGDFGCGTASGGGSTCSESCQCTNGAMICTGNCDGGL